MLILLFTASCNFKYPGYKKIRGGVYYKLLQIGEEEHKPQTGDFITVSVEYKTINDSSFFKGMRKFQLTEPAYNGSIDACFNALAKDDKASFIIPAGPFYSQTLKTTMPSFLQPESDMIVIIEMLDIQTAVDYYKEKEAFMRWIEDFGEYEKVLLRQYIQTNRLQLKPMSSGLFYLPVKHGTGQRVSLGDTVILDYEGKFLNGKFFDSTKKRKEPFGFIYGEQMQVVKGLEEGIGMMREGEKAIFILPSELAFGSSGSSTGIIPPYTSLIFEVELLRVARSTKKAG